MSSPLSLHLRQFVSALLSCALAASTAGFSCSGEKESEFAQPPSSDLYKLSKRVNLVETPQSVSYKFVPSGKGNGIFGPTDYQLIAVLRYDQASLVRLKSRGTRLHVADRAVWLPERPDWFPASIVNAIKRCSDRWCIDGEEYSAAEFLKGGFVTGTYVIPERQDFVILMLRT